MVKAVGSDCDESDDTHRQPHGVTLIGSVRGDFVAVNSD